MFFKEKKVGEVIFGEGDRVKVLAINEKSFTLLITSKTDQIVKTIIFDKKNGKIGYDITRKFSLDPTIISASFNENKRDISITFLSEDPSIKLLTKYYIRYFSGNTTFSLWDNSIENPRMSFFRDKVYKIYNKTLQSTIFTNENGVIKLYDDELVSSSVVYVGYFDGNLTYVEYHAQENVYKVFYNINKVYKIVGCNFDEIVTCQVFLIDNERCFIVILSSDRFFIVFPHIPNFKISNKCVNELDDNKYDKIPLVFFEDGIIFTFTRSVFSIILLDRGGIPVYFNSNEYESFSLNMSSAEKVFLNPLVFMDTSNGNIVELSLNYDYIFEHVPGLINVCIHHCIRKYGNCSNLWPLFTISSLEKFWFSSMFSEYLLYFIYVEWGTFIFNNFQLESTRPPSLLHYIMSNRFEKLPVNFLETIDFSLFQSDVLPLVYLHILSLYVLFEMEDEIDDNIIEYLVKYLPVTGVFDLIFHKITKLNSLLLKHDFQEENEKELTWWRLKKESREHCSFHNTGTVSVDSTCVTQLEKFLNDNLDNYSVY